VPARWNSVPPGFAIATRHDGESLDVALRGELDMAATFRFEAEVERLLARPGVRRLVLDLADLTLIDSAGLGALLALRDRTQDRDIEMILMNPSAPVRRILDLSGTSAVLLD
jgi:stage II sporulation protein AA (anti-sigma F factor antagonist)